MSTLYSNSNGSGKSKPGRVPIVTPHKYGNNKVDAELEALKQRGLAKILNKHFTETTQKLEQEKAAVDEAIRDLEERKARTSEFHVSTNGGLSPLDEMCVKANRWRTECRRKERETILLYQRYVDKFGNTGMVAVPQWLPHDTPDTAVTSAPPPRRQPMQSIPSAAVPNIAKQIEESLEEYLKQGGVTYPSIQIHGREQSYQALHKKEETDFRNFYRKMLEEKGVDVKAHGFKITDHPDYPGFEVDPFVRHIDENEWEDQIDAAVAAAEAGFPMATVHEEDQDMCSIVSGLTTLHSAVTREMIQDCERSVATFLREEQDHIRRIIEKEADDGTAASMCDASEKATLEAESMVQQMEDILNEYQSHHAPQSKTSQSKEPRPYDTGNPEENWMVYYDEFYQQEYYHEKKTNRTQWEPPDCGASSTSLSSDQLSHNEVMPDVGASAKRVMAYRRKRRKVRRRKLLLIVWGAVFLAMGSYYYLWTTDPDAVEPVRQFLGLPESPKLKERRMLLAQEYEAERRRLEEEEAEFAAAIGTRSLIATAEEKKDVVRRPWYCNIPLAYLVHGRCRSLAKEKPWFDLQELVGSMLQ